MSLNPSSATQPSGFSRLNSLRVNERITQERLWNGSLQEVLTLKFPSLSISSTSFMVNPGHLRLPASFIPEGARGVDHPSVRIAQQRQSQACSTLAYPRFPGEATRLAFSALYRAQQPCLVPLKRSLVRLAMEGRYWAGWARVLVEPKAAAEGTHVSWETSWQGCFSRMATYSEPSLPGNASAKCFSPNLKYLKKSDRPIARSSSTMGNGKAKDNFSLSRGSVVASEKAHHNTHMAATPNSQNPGTKEQDLHNPKARPLAPPGKRVQGYPGSLLCMEAKVRSRRKRLCK